MKFQAKLIYQKIIIIMVLDFSLKPQDGLSGDGLTSLAPLISDLVPAWDGKFMRVSVKRE